MKKLNVAYYLFHTPIYFMDPYSEMYSFFYNLIKNKKLFFYLWFVSFIFHASFTLSIVTYFNFFNLTKNKETFFHFCEPLKKKYSMSKNIKHESNPKVLL